MSDGFDQELIELNATLDRLTSIQRNDPEATEHRDAIRAVTARIAALVAKRGGTPKARQAPPASRRKSTTRIADLQDSRKSAARRKR